MSINRRTVVAGHDDGGISFWDVETGMMKEIRLLGQSSGIGSIAMSNDKRYAVNGFLVSTVCIWNISTGRLVGDALHSHECHMTALQSVMTVGDLYPPLMTRHFVGNCRAEGRSERRSENRLTVTQSGYVV